MNVVLTGGTGLVGAQVLSALLAAGHTVTAIVRSTQSADAVTSAGATARIGDMTDGAWLRDQFAEGDGAIHTASPGDASSADFDATVVQAAVAAYHGTNKPYIHTSGVWVYGSGRDITEQTPFAPPALTAWREGVEAQLLADDTVRGAIIAPGVVYGNGQGLPSLLATPDAHGSVRLIGDGTQHWTTVSAEQLADLYVRALTEPDARGYYLGVNDDRPTVRELGDAAAAAADAGPAIAETAEASRDRLFAPLADALLLDQVASAATRARTELGWRPTGSSLLSDIAAGAYLHNA